MANVQTKNGFTRIANELYDKIIKAKLNGSQAKILHAIIRNTYGYNRKTTNLSYNYLAKATNISQRQAVDTLKSLKDMNMVFVTDNGKGKTNTLSINKDFDTWTLSSEVEFSSEQQFSSEAEFIGVVNCSSEEVVNCSSEEVVNCSSDKKEKKKDINKNSANAHFEHIWSLYPNKKGKGQVSDSKKKELAKISLEEWQRIIDRYKNSIDTDHRSGFKRCYQNGSTFFNSGYVDYTDENYAEPEENESEDTWRGYEKL